jgi:transcriptional regulator with XRE-family HTH domain
MRIRTPIDLGALIRERRKALGLDQKTLAENVGVSRKWMSMSSRANLKGDEKAPPRPRCV